jgi:hypothetical protein
MSDTTFNNGDCDLLSSKLIRHKQIQELANASEVVITFSDLNEREAYHLLLFLRQDNAGYKVKSPVSIEISYQSPL